MANITPDLQNLATDITTLKPLPGNPRKGDIQAVANSYSRFGQRKPIVALPDGTVIAGNHQLAAAKQLGWTHIAVTRVDDDDATAKAFALADNRTADLGDYDNDAIADFIRDIVAADPSLMLDTGYSLEDIDAILGPDDPIDPDADPDDVPEEPEAPVSKTGDVWLLGKHRVVCGDSLNPNVLATALNNTKADCVMTDPPYNVDYTGGTGLTIENDSMTPDQFTKFLHDAYHAMYLNAKDGCPIYVWHADSGGQDFRQQLVTSGWMLKQVLIWVKSAFTLGRQDYQWMHEPCIYGWKPGAAHPWHGEFNKSTVIDEAPDLTKLSKNELVEMLTAVVTDSTIIREPKPNRNGEHPTMKPVRLLERLLTNSALPGQLILDPFGGSGSTLIAAHSLGMRAGLVELDPKYVDVICTRYQKLTGTTPILERTGEPHDFIGDPDGT